MKTDHVLTRHKLKWKGLTIVKFCIGLYLNPIKAGRENLISKRKKCI